MQSIRHRLLQSPDKARWLTASLVGLLVAYPFFPTRQVFVSLLITLVLLSNLYTDAERKRGWWLELSVGLVAILTTWLALAFPNHFAVVLASHLSDVAYIGISLVLLVDHLFRSQSISRNLLYSALNGYLLCGLLGATTAATLDLLDPHSFRFPPESVGYGFARFLYYSYVTLTTLGYGDITPVKPHAKTLTILLSVFGQVYLTFLVGMLMGKYLNDKSTT